MNLPRQYSYNPRLRLIVLPMCAGIAWISLVDALCSCRPHGFSLWFGLVPIIVGIVLAIRRLAFSCFLSLDKDALTLPSGFLRVRTTRIPYTSIERVWQIHVVWMPVLCVATKNGKFDVLSGMLPDAESYISLGDFLHSRTQNNQKV